MSNPVSFKITRESQPSASSSAAPRSRSHHNGGRHHHNRYASDSDSGSDDDGRAFNRRDKGKGRAEAITSIDKNGVRSANEAPKVKSLVIPSQPNKDFRRAALELRAAKKGLSFLPGTNNGASGELIDKNGKKRELTEDEKAFLQSGTNVQRIGTGVVTGGIRERRSNGSSQHRDGSATPVPEGNGDTQDIDMADSTPTAKDELSADAMALRELLAANSDEPAGPKVHIIPQEADNVSEQDAYAHDIAGRPDSATMEDYERVPIEDFGAALLRGMGGGNKPRKVTQAYVPKSRTALLGIGAKNREETFGKDFVLAANGGKKETKRDGMKFIPLARVERTSGTGSGTASPAPPQVLEDAEKSSSSRSKRDEDRHSRSDRDRYRDDDRQSSSSSRRRRDDYDYDDREYKKSKKRRDDDFPSDDNKDRRRRRDRSRSRSPGRSSRKDRDYKERERESSRRDRPSSRERSSYNERDSDRKDKYRSERRG